MKPDNGPHSRFHPLSGFHPSSLKSSFDSMPDRKPFLLRIDPAVLEELQHWADDDLRSLNGQIEWLLRRLLVERGRMKEPAEKPAKGSGANRKS